ncbi:cytoplasmic protein, partial [Enterobacter hormaechei]
MRVAESIILDALTRGGCIKTFYRISSRQAAESATRIPEGYILESPGEREDIVL